MASRLHLPFPVLSDEKLALTRALDLPTMEVAGLTLIKRLALIIDDARITHVFYPVFPPDRNAGDVLAWLKENPVSLFATALAHTLRRHPAHASKERAGAVMDAAQERPSITKCESAGYYPKSAFTFANTLRNISGVSTRVLVL